MYEYLDRRYASALYQVAEKNGKVDEYIEDLKNICTLIYDNEEFYKILKHPQISTSQKKKMFINIFKGKIDEELLSFLLILIQKDRIMFLREKLKQMQHIYLEKNNTLKAHVKSAIPLDDKEIDNLRNKLEKKYDKKIILINEIDKEIIGGLYVRVGDDVIDGTLRSKLHEMKDLMLNRR